MIDIPQLDIQGHNCNDVTGVIKKCNNLSLIPITNVLVCFAFIEGKGQCVYMKQPDMSS